MHEGQYYDVDTVVGAVRVQGFLVWPLTLGTLG